MVLVQCREESEPWPHAFMQHIYINSNVPKTRLDIFAQKQRRKDQIQSVPLIGIRRAWASSFIEKKLPLKPSASRQILIRRTKWRPLERNCFWGHPLRQNTLLICRNLWRREGTRRVQLLQQSQTVCLSESGTNLELESVFLPPFFFSHCESLVIVVRSNNGKREDNTHTHARARISTEEGSGRYFTLPMLIEQQMELATHVRRPTCS